MLDKEFVIELKIELLNMLKPISYQLYEKLIFNLSLTWKWNGFINDQENKKTRESAFENLLEILHSDEKKLMIPVIRCLFNYFSSENSEHIFKDLNSSKQENFPSNFIIHFEKSSFSKSPKEKFSAKEEGRDLKPIDAPIDFKEFIYELTGQRNKIAQVLNGLAHNQEIDEDIREEAWSMLSMINFFPEDG